jgi:hypothetical protein
MDGTLHNANTLEGFKSFNTKEVLDRTASAIEESIKSGTFMQDARVLNSFTIVSHADLKKYKFLFLFSSPALIPTEPFHRLASQPAPEELLRACTRDGLPSMFIISEGRIETLDFLPKFDAERDVLAFVDPSGDAPGWYACAVMRANIVQACTQSSLCCFRASS